MSRLADIAVPLRLFKPRRLFAFITAGECEHLAGQARRSGRSGHFAISIGGSKLRALAGGRVRRSCEWGPGPEWVGKPSAGKQPEWEMGSLAISSDDGRCESIEQHGRCLAQLAVQRTYNQA
jgi:hypothetical protein